DLYVKLTMPELTIPGPSADGWYGGALRPAWDRAHCAASTAVANRDESTARLRAASQRRLLIGRVTSAREALRYWGSIAVALTAVGALVNSVLWGTRALARWLG